MSLLLRIIRLTLIALPVMAAGYLAVNYKLALYGWAQLRGQLHIILAARPVEDCLKDPAFPDSLKKKLLFIADVRQYATDSLGLNNSKNYTSLYDQQGKPALWVLTACAPYAMQPYEWTFPLLGAVSYKGFFEKERGLPEAAGLEAAGYDVDYHPTGGWSTLGWFRDPILSNMLRKREGQLAELIIHELSHATLFLPGSVDYNENFATFVGEQGALRYLEHRFGTNSKELQQYRFEQEDEARFGRYMLRAGRALEQLYKGMNDTLTEAEKKQIKQTAIRDIVLNIKPLNLHYADRYPRYTADSLLPNNCYFMTYSRYRKSQTEFQAALQQYNGDMRLWISRLREENN